MRSGQQVLTAGSTQLKNSLPWGGELYTIIPYFIYTCNIIYPYQIKAFSTYYYKSKHSR